MGRISQGLFGAAQDPQVEASRARTAAPRAPAFEGPLNDFVDSGAQIEQQRLTATAALRRPDAPAPAPSGGRIGYNPNTGEFLIGQERLPGDAPTMIELSQLDPARLPPIDTAALPAGFITVTPEMLARRLQNTDRELDVSTIPAAALENIGYLADAAGSLVTATDMDGDGAGAFGLRGDWIRNPYQGMTAEIRSGQSLEKQLGYMEGGLESATGFGNALLRGSETIVPAVAAGALTRSPQVVGTIVGAGMAGGMQASDARESIAAALGRIDDQTLQATNREYAALRATMDETQAREVLAQQGAAVAGGIGAATAAPEYLLGLRAGRQIFGANRTASRLLGAPDRIDDAIAGALTRRAGVGGRVAGGAAVGGVGEGLQEVAETSLSQAGGAAAAGPGAGSTNPLDYASWDDFQNAAPVGMLIGGAAMGLRNGRRAADTARDGVDNAIAGADPALGAAAAGVQAGTDAPGRPAPPSEIFGDRGWQASPQYDPAVEEAQRQIQLAESWLDARYPGGWQDRFDEVAADPANNGVIRALMSAEYTLRQWELQRQQGAAARVRNPLTPAVDPGSPDPLQAAAPAQAGTAMVPVGPAVPTVEGTVEDPRQLPPPGPVTDRRRLLAAEQAGDTAIPMGQEPSGAPQIPVMPGGQRIRQRLNERNAPPMQAPPGTALPSPEALTQQRVSEIEQDAGALNAELETLYAAAEQIGGPDWRSNGRMRMRNVGKALLADIAALEQQVSDLATRAQSTVPVPAGAPQAPQANPPGNPAEFSLDGGRRSPAPAPPPEAPTEEAPEGGRPMGVAPAPLPNPEPMSPGEAQSRAATQAERGTPAPAPSAPAPAPSAPAPAPSAPAGARLRRGAGAAARVAAPAATEARETTSEPAQDIAAQIRAMLDPNNPKDTVWVSAADVGKIPGNLPARVKRLARRAGTLLTTSDRKYQEARKRRADFTNAFIGRLLGVAVQSSDEVAARAAQGEPAVAVEGRDETGAVAAAAVATPDAAPETAERVQAQTPPGGRVTVTDVREAQASRQERQSAPAAPAAPAAPSTLDPVALAEQIYVDPVFTPKEAAAFIAEREAEQDLLPDQRVVFVDTLWGQWESQQPTAEDIQRAAEAAYDELQADSSRDNAEIVQQDLDLQVGPVSAAVMRAVRAALKMSKAGRTPELQLPDPPTRPAPRAAARESAPKAAKLKRGKAAADDERAPAAAGAAQRAQADQNLEAANPGLDMEGVRAVASQLFNAARREAQALRAGGWNRNASVVRRFVNVIVPPGRVTDSPASENALRRQIVELAKASLEDITDFVLSVRETLGESTFARVLATGTTGVPDPVTDADVDGADGSRPAGSKFQITLKPGQDLPTATGRVNATASIPVELGRVFDGWLTKLASGNQAFADMVGAPRRVIVGTSAELNAMFSGTNFPAEGYGYASIRELDGERVALVVLNPAKFAAKTTNARKREALMLQVAAHEFGHVVERGMFASLPAAEQQAVIAAYRQWLEVQKSPLEAAAARAMPTLHRALLDAAASNAASDSYHDPAYAASYREWSADMIGRFLLTDAEARGVVEQFFAKVAEYLKVLFRLVAGESAFPPDAAIAQTMRAMMARARAQTPPKFSLGRDYYDTLEYTAETKRMALLGTGKRDAIGGAPAAMEAIEKAQPGGFAASARQAIRDFELRDVPGAAQTANRALWRTKAGQLLRRAGYSLQTLRQLEERFRGAGKFGEGLSRWVDLQFRKAQLANQYMEEGNLAMQDAHALSADQRATLQKVMRLATYYKVHPDLAFDDPKNRHLNVKDDPVRQHNAGRWTEVRALYDALNDDAKAAYARLRDSAMEMHKRTLDLTIGRIDAMIAERESVDSNAARAEIELFKEQRALHERNRRDMGKGPYFPLMRFGDFIRVAELPGETMRADGDALFTTYKDAQTEAKRLEATNPGATVSIVPVRAEDTDAVEGFELFMSNKAVYFFESEAEADAATDAIMADIREAWNAVGVDLETLQRTAPEKIVLLDTQLKSAYFAQDSAVPARFIKLMDELKSEGKLDPEVHRAFAEMAMQSLPEMSFRHTAMRRRNVLGADEDMLRSYGHRLTGGAHSLANLVVEPDVRAAWRQMTDAVSARTTPEQRSENIGGETLSTVRQAMDSIRDQQQALADRMEYTATNRMANLITDISSFFSLSFSVAYAAVNALQPTMVSMPVLAGIVGQNGKVLGAATASKYLFEAYAGREGGQSAPAFFTKRAWSDFVNEARNLLGKAAAKRVDPAKALLDEFAPEGTGERAMLEALLERGTLDFSFLNSLQDAMRGGKLEQKWATVQRLGMAFPQQIEAMNRVVTALAAYRMGVEHLGHDPATPDGSAALLRLSDDIVARTQLDYSRANRPELFNRPLPGILLQFKLYMQGMYMLMLRNGVAALSPRSSRAERKQALATLGYFFGTHALMGGATGVLPIAGPAGFIAMALLGDDEDEFKDTSQWARAMIADLTGSDAAAEVAMRGLPTLLGLDIGDRIGIPLAVDLRYAGIREGDRPQTMFDATVLNVLGGAPYATAKRVFSGAYDATSRAAEGDIEGAVRSGTGALPAGLRGPLRAILQSTEGLVDRDGDVFVKPEELASWDLLQQAAGLQSASVSQRFRERSDTYEVQARIQRTRDSILRRYRTTPASERDALRQEIRDFNRTAPREFQIRPGDTIRSVRAAERRAQGEQPRNFEAAERYLRD